MENDILVVKNLKKSFGKFKVVDNISFTVKKGDIFGFLGPNGAGKTTTIRIMLGLLKPDEGNIYINGKNIKDDFYNAISNVGALVEGPAFYNYMTAEENLEAFGVYSGNISKQRIQELLDLVGLSNREKDKVKEYSLGMKQRLGIAQALLNSPDLIILDEPINGLDPKGIKEIRELILQLSKKGITVFLSSHILSEVEQICNKVLIIDKGKEVKQGLVKELLKKTNIYDIKSTDTNKLVNVLKDINGIQIKDVKEIVRIQINNRLLPEDLLDILISKNLKIKMYFPVKFSLEDYFFNSLEES